MGFVQSIADPCVFMSAEVVCLIYVDDALLFYKSPQATESLKQKMRDDGMLFCDKDSVTGYLGVHIDRREEGTIHLTQSSLAGRIVEAMHLNDKTVDPVDTPCTKFLPLDEFGCPAYGELAILPSLGNSTTYRVIHVQISRWQPLNVIGTFITQNDLTN